MWLLMCSLAFAVRLTEDDLRGMLREAAPKLEAVAGRKFAELPELYLGEPAEITLALAADFRRRQGPITPEIATRLEAAGTTATAVYSSATRRIYVNIPQLREMLRRAEARRTDPRPQALAVITHELAHALQHQYGGPGSVAGTMIREGHATWLADRALSGAAREQARQEAGLHRLGSADLTPELRPYVVGYAAVQSIAELAGPEAAWALIADPPEAAALEALAALQARPDWPPADFPARLGLALGEPTVEVTGAWWYAARLMDEYRLQRVQGAGAAVSATWTEGSRRAAAGVMLFEDDDDATTVLESRRGSMGRSSIYLFFTIGGWRSNGVTRTVPGLRAGDDFDTGMTFNVVATSGETYRESWIRKGAELRVLATRGLAPRALREPLAQLASWPATPPAPGTASPAAREAFEALGPRPVADPTRLDAAWAALVVEARVATGMACADAVAAWRDRVLPSQAGTLDAYAREGCPRR